MLSLLKLLPFILQSIIAVNDLIGRGKGQTKKKIILDAIVTGNEIAGGVDNKTVKLISTVIDTTVKNLNDAGIFETRPVAESVPKPIANLID